MARAPFVRIEPFNVAGVAQMFARAPDLMLAELDTAMTLITTHLEREVKDRTPTAHGTLRASIFGEVQLATEGVLGVVASPLAHAEYVELGTRPHFPPLEPLEDWVRVKFGLTDEEEIKRAAMSVARAIAARGTLAVGMFNRAFSANRAQIEALLARVPEKVVARMAADSSADVWAAEGGANV